LSRSFAIASNGVGYGPAEALTDYLVERGHRVVAVAHPLTREQGTRHRVAEYAEGELVRKRSIRVPLRPPLSFIADPLVPLRVPRVDAWFGFNPLACARGLVARRRGRAGKAILWSVDFVPDRFGKTPLTNLYNILDRFCCTHADARIELSDAAQAARDRHHRLGPEAPPAVVVPMGAWLDRTPQVPSDGLERRRVVFLGHLVPRQGVSLLLEAIAQLARRNLTVEVDIVGDGPLLEELQALASRLGVDEIAHFHGFVEEQSRLEELLAEASLAVAPYRPDLDSLTRYADPGKLKAYLAAGLPTVLTDVPPNAHELAREAGAAIVPFDACALAEGIESALASPERWRRRREDALAYARRFDWGILLEDALAAVGVEA
jgi:glycosyltransferase involved in cell wall biosynthesis